MKRRFQRLAQKTYEVFHTPWRSLKPQGMQQTHALLLQISNINPKPNLGDDDSRNPKSPLPPNNSVHNSNQDPHQGEDYLDSLAPGTQPSTAANRGADSPHSSDPEIENQHEVPEFTTGPNRMINSYDGLAMLLTKDTVVQLSQVIQSSHELNSLKIQHSEANRKVQRTRDHMENLEFSIESSNNDDEKTKFRQERDKLEPTYRKNKKRRDELDHELDFLQIEVNHIRSQSLGTFETVLNQANLLDMPESTPDPILEESFEDQPTIYPWQSPEPESMAFHESDEHPSGLSKSEIVTILEEVETTRQNLYHAEEVFESTRNNNDIDKQNFRDARARGTQAFTEDELDLFHFQAGARNTRALIVAEKEHKEAKAFARRLGLLENDFEQESDFADDPDDGYRESKEADPKAGPNMEYIEEWGGDVVECRNLFALELERRASGNRTSTSVALSDTLSCVDLDPEHRRRIDQWQEKMSFERDEGQLLQQQFSLKRRNSLPALESCKRQRTEEPAMPAMIRTISCSNLSGEASEREKTVTYSHKTLLAIFHPNKAIDW